MMRALIALVALAGLIVFGGAAPAAPAPSPATGLPSAAASARTLDAADLETWLDGYMKFALRREDIAGAVVVVVKDGAVLFQKGYGYADAAARTPVDPEKTLFRPGSISKTFTWTAVMQLVEQGRIDLDRDVNAYLDFKIPERFGTPITMRNLMTHTGGFEETSKGVIGTDPKAVPALGDYVKRWVPDRIFRPGTTPAYSNYGTALAGYIVERVSGERFDDYIDRHIFRPLGMTHSTMRQPLPDRLRAFMSKGYPLGSGKPKPYELFGPGPAGSLAASGGDMARFMIAHLENGAYGNARILKPETARAMHMTALTILPAVNRMVLGFYETPRNGRRIIGHSGDSQWFHSAMRLFLDDRIGLFVSMNSDARSGGTDAVRVDLFEQFADRYLPAVAAPAADERAPDRVTALAHARMMEGLYASTRRSSSNFFAFPDLFGQTRVTAHDDGTVSVDTLTDIGDQPRRWREVAPFVWRDVNGTDLMSAKVDKGRVVMFAGAENSPYMLYLPVPWFTSAAWLVPAFFAAFAIFGITILLWPVAALLRRRHAVAFPYVGGEAKAWRTVRVTAVATLLMLLGFFALLSAIGSDFTILTAKLDPWLWLLQFLALLALVGGVAASAWHVRATWAARRSWTARIWSLALLLSSLVMLWIGYAFGLIALTTHY